ncbi:MAG: adenylate/guanylate cyclase domain-containing protein [Actinomycetota bacterium]
MEIPDTRYAKTSDGVHIAYASTGEGPDLIFIPGFVSNVELFWEDPDASAFFSRLSRFVRVSVLDKRGTGLSDPVPNDDLPPIEVRMDDVRAVMDAIGADQAFIAGHSEGGQNCAVFAATYPERTLGLILLTSDVRAAWAPDHPWGMKREEWEAEQMLIERGWGTGEYMASFFPQIMPSLAGDERARQRFTRFWRRSASPAAAMAVNGMWWETDIRRVLPAITVPTLILWRSGSPWAQESRYLAEHVPHARAVEIEGPDHVPWAGDTEPFLSDIEEFVTGTRPAVEPDRVLATVLFTDIVGSTERAAAIGDARWRELLEAHHAAVRAQLERSRGKDIDTAGDGFLATFDGPARAVRCALAIMSSLRDVGLEIRAGVHTGEIELLGDNVAGLAVHIGARVAALAGPNEVLVSSTVKDLTAGSGLLFEDAGEHELKGVPDRWHLYRVVSEGA